MVREGGGSDVFVWVFVKGHHALVLSRKWEEEDHDLFRQISKISKIPRPRP